MKKTFSVVLLFTTVNILLCNSQFPPCSRNISKYRIVDESNIKITYSLLFKFSEQNQEYYKDTRIVQVGNRIIKDFSPIVYYTDSIATDAEKKGASGIPTLQEVIFPYEIFNNYEKTKSLVIYRTFVSGPALKYFDNKSYLKWELKDGNKTILGYKCQQATTQFAGRKYTAWFTMELPIDAGPYKFSGLPGLILEVEESDRFFVWTAIGIKKIKEPIVEYQYDDYQNCTRKEADETIKMMFAKPFSFLLPYSAGITVVRQDGTTYRGSIENEIPILYEPLER